jgi:hypothetical protein
MTTNKTKQKSNKHLHLFNKYTKQGDKINITKQTIIITRVRLKG